MSDGREIIVLFYNYINSAHILFVIDTYAIRVQLVKHNQNTTRKPPVTATHVFGFKLQIWN